MLSPDPETLLRALPPARPSPSLAHAIAAEFSKTPLPRAGIIPRPRRGWLRELGIGFTWATAGAAAMLLLHPALSGSRSGIAAAGAPASEWQAVSTSREELVSEPGALIVSADAGPARYVRTRSIERRVWSDGASGASLAVEVPREDVRLLQVSFQ